MALIKSLMHGFASAGVITSVFTFHPRHERVYQRLLNMTTVAYGSQTDGLDNAPSVFMRMEMATIPGHWLLEADGSMK